MEKMLMQYRDYFSLQIKESWRFQCWKNGELILKIEELIAGGSDRGSWSLQARLSIEKYTFASNDIVLFIHLWFYSKKKKHEPEK